MLSILAPPALDISGELSTFFSFANLPLTAQLHSFPLYCWYLLFNRLGQVRVPSLYITVFSIDSHPFRTLGYSCVSVVASNSLSSLWSRIVTPLSFQQTMRIRSITSLLKACMHPRSCNHQNYQSPTVQTMGALSKAFVNSAINKNNNAFSITYSYE